ncbi:MAG: transcriptional repressor [Gammaproteobacteria bacterium]|nr:transcriptional repressor [Gammaproteobacteria bacterium]
MEKHEVIKLLQSQQINPTRQRVDIGQLLFARPCHLCADQVLEELDGRGRTSKATVYNTLNLFSRHGLVREVCVDGGKVYFDSNTEQHHHIYNVDTGELWDVDGVAHFAQSLPELPRGTTAVGVEVIYRVRRAD